MATHDAAVSLCAPDEEKTCFACCPPIRPHGYEHIHYRVAVRRMLVENTERFRKEGLHFAPIAGFSCWALGFTDPKRGRVGCLLHPQQHNGADYRYLVDYGEKCRRESCTAARVFEALTPKTQRFWLQLVRDLDSFAYSSPRFNPLFRLCGWGASVLETVARQEAGREYEPASFFRACPFFRTSLNPRSNAYLLTRIIAAGFEERIWDPRMVRRVEAFSTELTKRLAGGRLPSGRTFTHRLDADPLFLDFLRLGLGQKKTDADQAARLKNETDGAINEFLHKLNKEGGTAVKRTGKWGKQASGVEGG